MKTPRLALIFGLAVAATAPIFGQALTGTSLTVSSAGASTLTGTLTVSGVATFNNNLVVTGWADVMNNQFTLGASGTVFSNWLFTDSATDTLANVLNRGSASWLWAHGTTGAPVPAMRLDSTHQLLLFNAAGTTAGITLTPVSNQISLGTATLSGSGANLTVGGALTVTSGITNTTGALTGPTALSLTAGGTNQNITLTPSGSGNTILNGNVGIGTASPLAKLDVKLATNQHVGIYNNGGVTTLAGLNDAGNLANLKLEGTPLAFGGAGGVEHIRIDSTGKVGIGTATPSSLLDIYSPTAGYAYTGYQAYAGATHWYVGSGNSGVTIQDFGIGQSYIGNNPRLMIAYSTGNVGIGTTNPTRKLDVNGDANIATNLVVQSGAYTGNLFTLGSGLNIRNGGAGNLMYLAETGNVGIATTSPGATMEVYRSSGGGAQFRLNTGFGGGNAVDLNPFITGINNGGFELAIAGTRRLVVDPTGNVGIGTTTPGFKLDVSGDMRVGETSTRHYLNVAASNWPEIRYTTPTSDGLVRLGVAPANATGYPVGDGDWYAYMGNTGHMDIVVKTNDNVLLTPTAGNVGIGTIDPGTYKLAVKGSIHAQEVVVDNSNWADYVFEKDYRLAPLSEVEQHIKAEKHLPGIPSAQEIAEHGVSMGDMQSKLLSKIEELTLHMIQQEKQQVEQQKLMTAQQSEIAALRQQVSELKASANP